ncbi:hypothetical protein PVIIG_06050 [Plasmodium vivax India VII]|uniref:PIR Superfamily Protein n=1 Tax=Plasmodium vivax India VII TaxID=1077284 RepID=A0A0J9S4B2_PLAVI|nr:hypothetical protein PVIIG_06050 [Plasmodium vivax India VII]
MCSQDSDEESYEFFENIVEYVKKAKSAETAAASSNAETKCKSFMLAYGSRFKAEETARTICEQFINLYNSLNDPECNLNSYPNKKCCKFLKYWINFKLMKSMKNEDECVSKIYNALESHITGSDEFNIDLYYEYDINKDDLKKMNILYSLYEKHTELDTILMNISKVDKESLLLHSTACCTHYIKAKYICNDDNNRNDNSVFCNKLTTFKSKYDALYEKAFQEGSDYANNFIKLEECSNNKIITTAVTGTVVGLIPLLGVLYKVSELNIKL